jgi:hypothetical protein
MTMTESVIEQAALAWLEGLGWIVRHGSEIDPGEMRVNDKECLFS